MTQEIKIKVTPTSRGNFSKLRKFKTGGQVPKFANPAGGIYHGVTYNPGSTWQKDVFSKFQGDIQAELAAAQTPEQKQAVIDKYNSAQTTYAGLRGENSDLANVQYNQGVRDYQNLINSDFGFVNQNGVKNGNAIGRYNYLAGDRKFENGDRADSWNPDGWWGGQTQDRTTLGYRGDWDENSDDYTNWQNQLGQYGMETFMDEDGAYKLRLKSTPQESPIENPSEETLVQNAISGTNNPLEFQGRPERQSSVWTDWRPLTTNLAADTINNIRQNQLEKQKKFTLQQAPQQNAVVTNDYLGRQIRNKIAADVRNRMKDQMGSDLDRNMQLLNSAEDKATQLEEQNALSATKEFQDSSTNVQNVANANEKVRVAVANTNAQQNDAARNNIILANQRLHATNNAAFKNWVNSMYSSHGQWLQNERMEDSRFERGLNDFEYQQNADALYEQSGLKALAEPDGVYKSRAYQSLKQQLIDDTEDGIEADDNGEITDAAIQAWIEANPNDPRVQAMEKQFEKEYHLANDYYERELNRLHANKTLKNLSIRGTVTNQGSRLGDYLSRGPRFSPAYKSGGKVARFIDYMQHYRKSQADAQKVNSEMAKGIQKQLDRDLGLIDKEVLLLLKQAFK